MCKEQSRPPRRGGRLSSVNMDPDRLLHEPVPAWPDGLRGYLEHRGQKVPVEIYAKTLGTGQLPDQPHTEVRQLDLQYDYDDLRGFRYIALGIPLRARTDDPCLWVIPYDDGEIVLAVCEGRVRYRDWPVFIQVLLRNDGAHIVGRPRMDNGGTPTKTQARKLERAARLCAAVLEGRFTLRGRPREERDLARIRLLTAALEALQENRSIDRESLSAWVRHPDSVTSVDGIADLLTRADWGMRARGAKPALPRLAAEVHRIRRRAGLSIAGVVQLAAQADWNLAELQKLVNKTHIRREETP
jgi:hypothetical protein